MANVDGKDQAIRALEARLSQTRTQLEQIRRALEEDVRSLERSLELLREEDENSAQVQEHHLSPWATLGPQEAVLKFLQEHPGKAYKPSTLSKELIRLGCKPKTRRNYPMVVRGACKVLIKKGRVAPTKVGDKAAFQLAEGGKGVSA